jgi:hypothetical protein
MVLLALQLRIDRIREFVVEPANAATFIKHAVSSR